MRPRCWTSILQLQGPWQIFELEDPPCAPKMRKGCLAQAGLHATRGRTAVRVCMRLAWQCVHVTVAPSISGTKPRSLKQLKLPHTQAGSLLSQKKLRTSEALSSPAGPAPAEAPAAGAPEAAAAFSGETAATSKMVLSDALLRSTHNR